LWKQIQQQYDLEILPKKKNEIKEAHYSEKLKLMQDQCDTLKNITNSLLHLIGTSNNTNQL